MNAWIVIINSKSKYQSEIWKKVILLVRNVAAKITEGYLMDLDIVREVALGIIIVPAAQPVREVLVQPVITEIF